jgi:hypothetical protein
MPNRRSLLAAALGALLLLRPALAQQAPSAATRMNELGPENEGMADRAGVWDVTETVWDAPDAAPTVTTGLVAKRRMIGSILEEVLRPASNPAGGAIARLDFLTFNRVEGRWDYVSMDTRAPVGIMPAWSFTRGEDAEIVLQFQPFALAGAGPGVTGQMLRMDTVIRRDGPDRDVKDQHFTLADGTGTAWLAHRYAYARRR